MSGLEAPAPAITASELARLERVVESNRERFLHELETLVNIDSGSYSRSGVQAVAQRLAAQFRALGAAVEERQNPRFGPTIVARWRGRAQDAPRLLLVGHMDTVFEDGTAAARPFRIEGQRAFGPGVTDMKSGLLAGIHALLALRSLDEDGDGRGDPGAIADSPARGDSRWLPFSELAFVANPDEEIGSPVSTPVIRELASDRDACFVLECARADGSIVSSRKGVLEVRIELSGRAAHAGIEPEKGRDAVLEAAHKTIALHALSGRWPGVSCNVGVVRGGSRPNVVADHATLEVDLRAPTRESLEWAEAAVAQIASSATVAGVSAQVVETGRHWPMEKLDGSVRLVEYARSIASALGFGLRDAATGGASDANTTAGMGLPTLDGLGPIGGGDHSRDEYLELDSIVPRVTLLAALLLVISREAATRRARGGSTQGAH